MAKASFWLAAVAITLLAGMLRFQALDSGLPHPRTRPDEEPLLQKTELPARGEFNLNWSVYPSAYVYLCWLWGDLGLRVGQEMGLLAAGDYLTAMRESRESLYLIDRALSAAAGTAAVLALMLLARRTLGSAAALVAGLLLATNFLHARDSHTFKPDVVLSLLVVVAFAAMLPLARRASLRTGALAGLAVGAAMAAKYPAVLLLIPVYAAALMGSPTRGWRRLVPLPAVVAGGTAAAFFLATSPFLFVSDRSLGMLSFILLQVFPQISPEMLPSARSPFGFADAAPGWKAFAYHARFSLWYGFGALPTLIAPLAAVWAFASRRPLPVLASIFALTWYAVMSLSPHMFARYFTPLAPILMLLEAGLLCALAARLPRGRALALGVLTALVVAQPLAATLSFNRVAGHTDTRVLATRWMAENLPAGARLAVYGNVFWYWGTPVAPPGMRYVDAKPQAASLEKQGIDYLVTHDHVLFSSTVEPSVMAELKPRLELLVEFDPAEPGRSGAVFEAADAYYIPVHGFGAVARPGPKIWIYAFE